MIIDIVTVTMATNQYQFKSAIGTFCIICYHKWIEDGTAPMAIIVVINPELKMHDCRNCLSVLLFLRQDFF